MRDLDTVLVTGAAGGVGRTICRILREQHLRVRGLVRPEDDLRVVPLPPSDVRVGYVQDPEVVAEALRGVDAVVHCAALLPNALHLAPAVFREVNVEGSLNVLRQASRQGVPRAFFFSTISVVDHVTRTITPATLRDYITDTNDPYLLSKINAEKELLRLQPTFGGRLAILRPAFIYGPGNFAVWRDGLELVLNRKMRLIGDGRAPLPLIYAEDIARLVLALLLEPVAGPQWSLHILANPEPTTLRAVFELIADHLKVSRPSRVPSWTVRMAAELAELLPASFRVGRLKLLTRSRVQQYSRGYDLTGVLDHAFLGQTALTSFREGLPRMLDDYLHQTQQRKAA